MTKKRQRGGGRGGRRYGSGEIVFDPEARAQYLRGFSERKKQRRAYGLAMQKVKDRKARLEHRAELKQAINEQVEQAEKQKEQLMEALLGDEHGDKNNTSINASSGNGDSSPAAVKKDVEKVQTYTDVQTQSQWGGEVVVTTSTNIPGDDDDEEDDDKEELLDRDHERLQQKKKHRKGIDSEQEYAGNVEKYLAELKGKMPGKKNKDRNHNHHHKHKGNHGAASQIGGTAGDLKIAQKALAKSSGKKNRGRGGNNNNNKNGSKGRRRRH